MPHEVVNHSVEIAKSVAPASWPAPLHLLAKDNWDAVFFDMLWRGILIPALLAAGILGLAIWFAILDRRYLKKMAARTYFVCKSCGYNLTGNVSGICPECGTPVPEDTRGKLAPGNGKPTAHSTGETRR